MITADRLIFDAAFNLNGDRDPFELDRAEIITIESIETPSKWATLHIETPKRKYDLIPYFGVSFDEMGFMTRGKVRKALAPELELFDEVVHSFDKALEKYRPPEHN